MTSDTEAQFLKESENGWDSSYEIKMVDSSIYLKSAYSSLNGIFFSKDLFDDGKPSKLGLTLKNDQDMQCLFGYVE